ncbi:hypothetical protein LOK46_25200 [Methylobacterium sp. NMS14P]|uniref:hypothetical protein n=1 Tax=Methylobacterium sp. NMS14P TaxID=2894310 RepID=UPI00235979FE|nr:hypothetical protein [Methylobacterium sp. NMS14P]WCS24395.1 hypothetical protein LOK46_25200 [Methylobacterium sp. NMS14P]
MAGTPLSQNLPHAAHRAETMAAQMALAAHALRMRGDVGTAESLLAMARHNRILGLKLRIEQDLAPRRNRAGRQATAGR